PAPTRPESRPSRVRAAGRSREPFRPRNSVRSPVHAVCAPRRSAKATRPAKSLLQVLRTYITFVTGSISVTMNGAEAFRDVPSTHSTYAVTDNRRGRPDPF